MEPTPIDRLDAIVDELRAKKDEWAKLPIPQRLDLLRRCLEHSLAAAEGLVRASCKHKGIAFDAPVSAEEWLAGPVVIVRNLRLLHESLTQIRDLGRPQLKPGSARKRPDGQLVVEVFPQGFLDKLLFAKLRAEIWMQPGETESSMLDSMAWAYRDLASQTGKVALVLGAGNVSSIGPMDVLYKLFVENQVCVLKMNPVNEYTGPHVEASLKPLVDAGYLHVVYGGADVGAHLVQHEGVDEIHITGSDAVHDIIVWGPPAEQAENKANGTPKIQKPITSELGCVTPVIILPGNWSEKELQYHAENVATMVANNASHNCNAAKTLLTWKGWAQRETFLARVQEILSGVPPRVTYYPGSDKKYDGFLEAHPDAKPLAERSEGKVPWTAIFGVDAANADDVIFTREAWCGVIAEAALDAPDEDQYAQAVVDFANDKLWGTLSCVLVADPATQRRLGSRFEDLVAKLRYGTVGVNAWGALSYAFAITTWGAFPGHTLEDIRSGIGVVHNTLMFKNPQKTVIWAPFTIAPKPPFFVTHRNGHQVAKKMLQFEYSPSFWKFPGIAISALGG